MPTEQDKTTAALRFAIQMEIDGKVFYARASQESQNPLGQKLLARLSEAEDYHRLKFEQIYDSIRRALGWPRTDFQADHGRSLRTIFARELEKKPAQVKPLKSELDAVQKAIEMEAKSYDFYHDRSEQVGSGPEKDFYETVKAEEREHQLVLNDYHEYMTNPAAWFVKTERQAIDG